MKDALYHCQLLVAQNVPLDELRVKMALHRKELKLDYIISDTAELLEQSIDGTERIARIVADLKSFSHVDESGDSDCDLNSELERTLTVIASQLPSGASFVRDFRPLPLFGCNPALLSQAFLNIIQNALLSRDKALEVTVSSKLEDDAIVIRIADNGSGIPAHNLTRVFEPFFTTRDVGRGTGMGLTVAREIVRGAGGTIEIDSHDGSGTTVTIRLPYKQMATDGVNHE